MSRRTQQDPTKIAILTVHGTGDTAPIVDGKPALDGDKWFQRGSAFTQRVIARLAGKGIEATIVPVPWSGANSSQGRERGASILAKAVRAASRTHGGVHVIGHSHGGNVANEAASMLGWKLRKNHKPMMTSVTTVGTPFFRAQLGNAESFGGIAFLAITVISIVALAVAALFTVALTAELPKYHLDTGLYQTDCTAIAAAVGENSPDTIAQCVNSRMEEARFNRGLLAVLGVMVPVGAIALFIIVPLAVQGFWRIMRVRRKKKDDAKFFSIWHPNDEAIAFLQRVDGLKLEPFPAGSFWRNSRTSAIVWGVRAVLIVAAIAVGMTVAAAFNVDVTDDTYRLIDARLNTNLMGLVGGMTAFDLALLLGVSATLGAPLIFGAAYILARVLLGLGLEIGARGTLNKSIGDVMRGMAFGRDGDTRLGGVANVSHSYGAVPMELLGDVAERMRIASAATSTALLEKYRWALFTVGDDTNDAVTQLSKDAMTWDSLIHTTYFDQPEVADAIADYIAGEVEKARTEQA